MRYIIRPKGNDIKKINASMLALIMILTAIPTMMFAVPTTIAGDYGCECGEPPCDYDFGDAPAPYPTLLADNGPRHIISPNFWLGASIDAETDGQPDLNAMGDDNQNLDDEDGVSMPSIIYNGSTVFINVVASQAGVLDAWVDFNADGDWDDTLPSGSERIFTHYQLSAGANALSFYVPEESLIYETTYARFRFSAIGVDSYTGCTCNGEVEDYKVYIDTDWETPMYGYPKWEQPPQPDGETGDFIGWDEPSVYDSTQIVADDWICTMDTPVTDIHWWGSYKNWSQQTPPEIMPQSFHIGIWTDVPAGDEPSYSHPGQMIWEYTVPLVSLNQQYVGMDSYPAMMETPEATFQYDLYPPQESWFYQGPGENIYWISIAAIYTETTPSNIWGWLTRPYEFNDKAIIITDPVAPIVGSTFVSGVPIDPAYSEYPEPMDMCFNLTTYVCENNPPNYWKNFMPTTYVSDFAPDCSVQVKDIGVGLDVSTAEYSYSTDGGASWSPWSSCACTGSDSSNAFETISVQNVPFNQDTLNDNNQIKFRIYDMCTNLGESPAYIVKIDTTGPLQTVEFSTPQESYYYGVSGETYTVVGPFTTIWINSTDAGIGSDSLEYYIQWGEEYGEWDHVSIPPQTVYDNVQTGNPWNSDSDMTPGKISVAITEDESCWHQTHYWCYDKLGFRAPPQGFIAQDFIVDATPPVSDEYFIGPVDGLWIGACTQKIITVTDEGCIPGGTGVQKVDWFIWKIIGENPEIVDLYTQGTVYDNGPGDNDPSDGTISFSMTCDQDCKHYFSWRAFDDMGNYDVPLGIDTPNKQKHWVDATPPETWLGFDGNNCQLTTDAYCVKLDTEIIIHTDNVGTAPCIYPQTMTFFRLQNTTGIWYPDPVTGEGNYDGYGSQAPRSFWKGVYWYNYTVPFSFTEECEHLLEFFAKDPLCNTEDTHQYTIYVDETPPIINKTVGDPHCIINDDEYCITTQTPIIIDAMNQGCCPSDISVEYKINEGSWVPVTIPYTLYMTEECNHTLTIHAWDCLGNMAEDIEIFHVDNTLPMILKTVGTPNCTIPPNEEYCVTTETPITIDAYDPGCCPSLTVEYKINDDDWTDITSMLPYTFTFEEECNHLLYIRAYDCLGHIVYDNETFHVDETTPTIEKTVGQPNCSVLPQFLKFNGDEDTYCVRTTTPITINASDPGCCPSLMVDYRVWNDTADSGWIAITELPYVFYFSEECMHHLDIRAYDCLGHITYDNETFYVDDTPPVIEKTVGDPNCMLGPGEYCITPNTPITINGWNEGCCIDQGFTLRYKINDGDWIYPAQLPEILTIPEACTHILTIEAWDCLGNIATDVETFHVDTTIPIIEKTVGQPNCPLFIQEPNFNGGDDDTYCVRTTTPITINASDPGCCPSLMVDYRVWNDTADSGWIAITELPYVFYFSEECMHHLDIRAYDCLGHITYDNETFYVDDTPPVIEKTVGDPNCMLGPGEYCITPNTPITINGWNEGCCIDQGFTLRYKINDGDWIYPAQLPEILTIPEACTHILTIEAWDCLGNIATDVETFHVDMTPPTITKTVGDPNCYIDEGTYCVTMETPITVEATDQGCNVPCGPVTIEYNISYNGQWTGWMLYTGAITFNEPCEHILMLRAYDCLGNGMDDQYWDIETFNVDNTTPVIEKTVGYPRCDLGNGSYCVTTQTNITINAYDEGCCDSLTVKYRINDGDWTDITTMLPYTFNFAEECMHTVDIWAYDCLGHTMYDNETFYVDNTPPMIEKTVGDPKMVIEEGVEYCVTQETEISVTAWEEGCCSLGTITIEYRIMYNNEWTDWMPYEGPISFTEDCNHTLEIRASDCLGNTAYDQELFHVDDTPPTLNKTVSYPSFYWGEDEYGHDTWYVFPQTHITFTAEDAGCCPCPEPMIYYRYWFLGHWTDWMTYTEPFSFNRGCLHYLEAYTVDCLGNIGPVDNETFIVHVPDGYDDPLINFENPLQGETYCERTLDVIINASDAQTPTQDLTVVLSIPGGRRGAPTLWYETTYNPEDGFFHASIDIFEYQDGAEITLEAYVIDGDNNYVVALPVTFTVCSNTGYDYWMQLGWESLTIPPGEIGCSDLVEDVLASIDGNYDWVFYRDTVTGIWYSFEYGEGGNDLHTMNTGEVYWIHMTTADRFYTDSYPPTVTISYPLNDVPLNVLDEINGTAYDGQTGLDCITVTIHDDTDNTFWDGDSWETITTELLCTGTDTWMYNASTVAFISGHTYEITAIAKDNAGCFVTDMVMFLWDANPPIINILDPVDGEERTSGPGDMNFEVYDLETSVSSVWVEIYDETTMMYYDGINWQANQVWLPVMYDTDDMYYYTSEGIWPTEVPQTFQITVKAYDLLNNMGLETSTFTIVEPQGECDAYKVYTTDADFDEGTLTNLEHTTVHNQLQMIPGQVTAFPNMWVANAGEDSLSKWDTNENKELARYHTWFGPLAYHDPWSGVAPSRTCVDSEGNCYVANRHFDGPPADVIKIYATNWIDRNHDGHLNTSWDINSDGTITADEMLPMTDLNMNNRIDDNEIVDERVAWVASVGGGGELGRSLAIDLEGNIWLGLYYGYCYYKLSNVNGSILGGPYYVGSTPYGALVDRYGYLWGSTLSSTLLKLNTRNPAEYTNYYVPSTYGIALGYDSLGNTLVYLGGNSPYVVFNSSTNTYSYPPNQLFYCNGIATDIQGNIVAGSSYDGSVAKFAPNGSILWNVAGQIATHIRGIVVDSDDNVWAIHLYDSKLAKYNGTNGAYMGIYNSGYEPYTYSDATGLSHATSVSVGTWDVVHDSHIANTQWNVISWTSDEQNGSKITVKVRSSNDQMSWSPWETATNNQMLSSTPIGRYLNILATFEQAATGVSPILYDLTVDGTCAGQQQIPHISLQKQVWVPGVETMNGYWAKTRNASVGDIVRFNISIDNDGQCPFLSGSLTDYLPNSLLYIDNSTIITVISNGEQVNVTGDQEPWVFQGQDYTTLLWNESGSVHDIPPNTQAYFEYEAWVINCSEPVVVNIANVTVNPACGDTLYAEDTATVNIQCQECNPTGTVDKAVWDNETKQWVPSIQATIGDEVNFGIHAIIPDDACTLYNGYMEDYLPDGLNYVPDSTNIILYYGGNLYQNISGSQCEPYITDHEGYVTLRWDSQNGYAETLPATGEVYISYRVEVMDTGTFVNVANGTGYTDAQIPVNDQGNATVVVPFVEPTHSISGTVYYEDIPESQLIIAYYDEEPTGQDPTGSIVIPEPLEFPIQYTISGLSDDTYYVFAFLDHDENMGPPEPDEPIGYAINNTVAEGFDPIEVNGADFTDADITLEIPPQQTCIEFSACVDGSDYITIENGLLSIYHDSQQPIGSTGDCAEWPDYCGSLTIDGDSYPIELPEGDDQYLINGIPYLPVSIQNLDSFSKLQGRGEVSWGESPHTIFVDDIEQDSADLYTIQLCGDPVICTPGGTVEKSVWRSEFSAWDSYTEVTTGDTVRFNITVTIPETGCYLMHGVMDDYLPTGLQYINGSTNMTFIYGDMYEHRNGSKYDPDIYPGADTNRLEWDSEQEYGVFITPDSTIFFEFEAKTLAAGEYENIANGTAYYTCCDYVYSQGSAMVYVNPENNPPNVPSDPNPMNGAIDVPVDSIMSWTGGDPDNGDTVTYDVYLEANDNTPDNLMSENQAVTTFDPGVLSYGTTYYWKIVATDNHNASTEGPIWNFTTLPPTAGPTIVNLRTAGDFVILSKSGISTTGTTSIVGDIGVSPIDSTAITGFALILDSSGEFATSSLVTGRVYAADYAPPTPTKMTTAVNDMETAYTDAAGRTLPDFTELGAGDIGGLTLVPGLYKWGTGVIIPTNVTLSGGANDVWIFQIAGTLDISSAKQVILSGGAQAKNIFWQVADVVTLGTTSVFKGNILSQTLIRLQTGATLDGRTLAQTAVTLDANTVTVPV
ncbi:MAG: DUF3494 domain-containing protein [Thermoplasmata archaeon]|nr:DUF3494 domain-containing protein [Thermoplasmata archaeon]